MRLGNVEVVRGFAEIFPAREPIVEIGSFLVEGPTLSPPDFRTFFPGRSYLGVDMRPGPRVDRVENFEGRTSFDDGSLGTIITCDTLEHVYDTFRFMEEVRRVLAPGGLLLAASVMYFPIHDHPHDYWRFTPEAFRRLIAPVGEPLVLTQGPADFPYTVAAVARRGGVLTREETERFTALVLGIPDSVTRPSWRHPGDVAEAAALRQRLFAAARTVLFDSRAAGAADSLLTSADLTLERTGTGLKALSSGNDPCVLLPPLDAGPAHGILLRFLVESAAESPFQIYFVPSGSRTYSEEASIIERVGAGRTELFVALPAVEPASRVRIDPLAAPGELTLLAIEARAL